MTETWPGHERKMGNGAILRAIRAFPDDECCINGEPAILDLAERVPLSYSQLDTRLRWLDDRGLVDRHDCVRINSHGMVKTVALADGDDGDDGIPSLRGGGEA